jgi:hypothetical protein
MCADAERKSFVAHDADGRRYLLVADRPASEAAGADRIGIWTYRTLDGRAVRREPGCRLYTVERGDIRLTTSDFAEPGG